MDMLIPLLVIVLLLVVVTSVLRKQRSHRRQKMIDHYRFPARVTAKVRQQYPHLTDQQVEQVITGLREYFHVCNAAGAAMVAMPSQVVDVAWHEFILFTRQYQQFCNAALGRFLHHTPAEAMESPTRAQNGIRRAWRIACIREGIRPKDADRLPLLFALDAELGIEDGFHYSLNCQGRKDSHYCASHIGCSSGCGGDSGGDSGCGGGCGGD